MRRSKWEILRRAIGNVVFEVFVVIITLAAVLPATISKLFGHIRSWEGFFLSLGSLDKKAWIAFLWALIISLCAILLFIHLPMLIWTSLLKKYGSLKIRLARGRWTFCFSLPHSSLPQKPELTINKGIQSITWKNVSNLKWALLLFAGVLSFAAFPRDISLSAYWFEKYNLVAHAGGTSPNGNVYSNSLEAFEYNYRQGHRVFEGDLCLTADGILVLEHDWAHWHMKTGLQNTYEPVTYEEFMRTKFYGTETPMDLVALMDLMNKHQDMYFMTDFKNCFEESEVRSGFQQILRAAEEAGCVDVLNRFIIQNHHPQFKHWVESIYPFKNWLYTYYAIPMGDDRLPENFTAYCDKEDIPVIAIWDSMINDIWLENVQKYHLKVFIHTINDISYANEWIAAGASGIYTDDIKPGQLS